MPHDITIEHHNRLEQSDSLQNDVEQYCLKSPDDVMVIQNQSAADETSDFQAQNPEPQEFLVRYMSVFRASHSFQHYLKVMSLNIIQRRCN